MSSEAQRKIGNVGKRGSENCVVARPNDSCVASLKIAELLWLGLFNILLFEQVVQESTGFTYIDEIATIALVLCAVFCRLGSERFNLRLYGPMISLLFVIMIGLLSGLLSGVQLNAFPVLVDIFTICKFPLALFSSAIVFRGSSNILHILIIESKLLVSIMLLCGVANLFFDLGMGAEDRYGIARSFQFIFPHPTFLVIAVAGMVVLFSSQVGKNTKWVLLSLVVALLPLRSKGFVFAAIASVVVLFLKSGKLRWYHLVLCGFIALAIGWDQFTYYFQSDGFARTELLKSSFQIAEDYFPFGSGFATFGSAITADLDYYSPLYYSYGLSSVYGLGPDMTSYIADTFWPTVVGQFGFFGLVGYIVFLVSLFLTTYRRDKSGIPTILCFVYLLVSSTSESAFFNPQSVYLAVCLGVAASALKLRSSSEEHEESGKAK